MTKRTEIGLCEFELAVVDAHSQHAQRFIDHSILFKASLLVTEQITNKYIYFKKKKKKQQPASVSAN